MILLNSSQQLILFISAAGVIQAVILAGLLFFHPKSDRSVTSFLSLHVLTVSIFMLMPVLQYFFFWQSIILLVPFQFLIGPFLYLYLLSFKGTIKWRKAWPHFLLFVLFLLIDFPVYSGWIKKYPASATIPEELLFEPISVIQIMIRNVQMLVYYLLARRVLSSYQKTIHHLYSETSKINLLWVRWLLNGFLLLIITVLILAFFVFRYPERFSLLILINTAVITPYIYFIALKGLGQPTLWQIQPDKNKDKIEKEMFEAEKIETSKIEEKGSQPVIKGLPETKTTEIISRIIQLMEKDKLYQEPDLTLSALSDKLEIHSYQASQAINDRLKKNFYDLVNGYRVEEAKRLLLNPKNRNYTILSVGFEAGFNSKTTFNTVFKKFTGLTPTEFREQQRMKTVLA